MSLITIALGICFQEIIFWPWTQTRGMAIEQKITQQRTQMSSEKSAKIFITKTKINKVAFLAFILFTVLC